MSQGIISNQVEALAFRKEHQAEALASGQRWAKASAAAGTIALLALPLVGRAWWRTFNRIDRNSVRHPLFFLAGVMSSPFLLTGICFSFIPLSDDKPFVDYLLSRRAKNEGKPFRFLRGPLAAYPHYEYRARRVHPRLVQTRFLDKYKRAINELEDWYEPLLKRRDIYQEPAAYGAISLLMFGEIPEGNRQEVTLRGEHQSLHITYHSENGFPPNAIDTRNANFTFLEMREALDMIATKAHKGGNEMPSEAWRVVHKNALAFLQKDNWIADL